MNPEKKLKLILASFKDKEIIKFLDSFLVHFPNHFKKTIRQISFNCYESVCEFKNKVVSGYGKNSNEAYINSVRTLIQLLADDTKMHRLMKECIRELHQQNPSNYDSQKKLLSVQKALKTNTTKNSLNVSTKIPQKKSTLKEQIFQYLNLDNLRISNPNASQKTKLHDKYLNKDSTSGDREKAHEQSVLEEILNKNKELERQLQKAKEQNQKLKGELDKKRIIKTNNWSNQESSKSRLTIKSINKQSLYQSKSKENDDPLKTKTSQYLNLSQDCKLAKNQRIRSISVENSQNQSQTQKYHIPKPPSNQPNEKKVLVPKQLLSITKIKSSSSPKLSWKIQQILEPVTP